MVINDRLVCKKRLGSPRYCGLDMWITKTVNGQRMKNGLFDLKIQPVIITMGNEGGIEYKYIVELHDAYLALHSRREGVEFML